MSVNLALLIFLEKRKLKSAGQTKKNQTVNHSINYLRNWHIFFPKREDIKQ